MNPTPVFRRIELQPETLSDKVVEEMRRLIVDGHFAAGDRLPPERELVDQLGISRTVLREALSSLEALGLIERSSTRGRFVARGGSSARSQTLVSAWLHQYASALAEVEEVRSLVESEAVRTTPLDTLPDVARKAREILADQRSALERGDTARAGVDDIELHRVLSSGAPNRTLLELATALIERSKRLSLAAYSIPELSNRSIEEHAAIVDAMDAGDVEEAAERLKRHILVSSRRNVEAAEQVDAALGDASDDAEGAAR